MQQFLVYICVSSVVFQCREQLLHIARSLHRSDLILLVAVTTRPEKVTVRSRYHAASLVFEQLSLVSCEESSDQKL